MLITTDSAQTMTSNYRWRTLLGIVRTRACRNPDNNEKESDGDVDTGDVEVVADSDGDGCLDTAIREGHAINALSSDDDRTKRRWLKAACESTVWQQIPHASRTRPQWRFPCFRQSTPYR